MSSIYVSILSMSREYLGILSKEQFLNNDLKKKLQMYVWVGDIFKHIIFFSL